MLFHSDPRTWYPSTWYQVLGTQVLGTKCLVPNTWYQALGTTWYTFRNLGPYFSLSWFHNLTGSKSLFSKIWISRAIEWAENQTSHTNFSFRVWWWGFWPLVSSNLPRYLPDDSGNLVIPRRFWSFQEPMGPMGPGPGPMGPFMANYRALFRTL